MKKLKKILIVSVAVLLALFATLTVLAGWQTGVGPFAFLQNFDKEVAAIEQRYDAQTRQNEIVFYGASNFRLWYEMENDLAEYKVQNHGFGGSTDTHLVQYASQILYPYSPSLVFFQTGSNDYVQLSGSDDDKIRVCMENKRQMFEQFHQQLPEAKLVVMSGLLLPGRSQYAALTQRINQQLAELCAEYDYMYFVDATAMTYDGSSFKEGLFEKDGIHLNHEGQLLWCNNYIRPQIEALIEEYGLEHLQR